MRFSHRFRISNYMLLLVVGLFLSTVSNAQILTFDFAGLAGNEATANSNTNNTNLTPSTISRGAGLTASTNADRFNATNWATTSIANAVTGNDYMEFTITPNSGFQFSVSSIVFQIQRSNSGFTAIALRSSVDGYASNLDAEKAVTDNTSTQTFTFTFTQTNSSTAVTYRLYGYAEVGTGSGGPGDGTGNDISVIGNVSATSGPNITTGGSLPLNTFISTGVGSPSAEQNFTVEGASLTNDIVITSPIGYQVSTTSGSGFGSSVTLTQSGGNVASTIIYARFNPTALSDQVGGNITITSIGASPQNVAVTGEVTNLAVGDIAFIAFQGVTTDYFRIVALNDIPANTRIWFTDKSWDGNGATLAFTSGEGVSVWTSPNSMTSKGTVIEFNATSGTVTLGTGPFTSGLGSTGEQLFAYQGLAATPSFVAGYTSGSIITTGVPTGVQTWVPTALTNGTNFVALGGVTFGSSYLTATTHTRSLSEHRTHIHTIGNLTTGNTSTQTYSSWPSYTFNFIAEEPTTQASFTAATSVGNNEMTLNFSGGNGTSYIVVMKQGSAVTGAPIDAFLTYTANTTFASGSTIAPGEFVVFNGTVASTSVTVTGLAAGITYHYAIFAYNGIGSTANYLTTSPGIGDQITTGAANSTSSDIIVNSVFTEPTNVDYASFQENINLTMGTSLEVAKFTLRDGGATADADANSTTLNAISFTLVNNSLLRRLALYDGTMEIAEIAVSGSTATFTGLTLVAADDSTQDFSVRASFAGSVTDNLQYSFTVSNVTADITGSGFAAANAGAAASSTTGDRNKIEVATTAIIFDQDVSAVAINTNMAPSPTVRAIDANVNFDLDNISNVIMTITAGTTTFGAGTTTVAMVGGEATFSNLQFTTIASSNKVTATQGAFTDESSFFNVTAGTTTLAVGDISIIGFRSDDNDGLTFVPWIDLNPGTVIKFTDNAFDGTTFNTNENEVIWTSPITLVTAGTVIVIGGPDYSNGSGSNIGSTTGALNGLSASGDNIFAYQGTSISASNVIFGIHVDGSTGWLTTGSPTTNNSYLPSTLNVAGGNIALSEVDNTQYTGTRVALSYAIHKSNVLNTSNWTGNDDPVVFGSLISTPFTLSVPVSPSVNLSVSANTANEADATSITVTATASAPVTGNQSVTVGITGTNITGDDYYLSSNTFTILNGQTQGSVTIIIMDDGVLESDETLTVTISNPTSGIVLGVTTSQVINIRENNCSFLRRVGTATSTNGAEVPAFDPSSNRIYVVTGNTIEYYSLSNTGVPTLGGTVAAGFTPPANTAAIPNSVGVNNGILAVAYAIQNTSTSAQESGRVAFYNATTGAFINVVVVGYLPDMLIFSPDGTKVLTADEGEPNSYGQGNSFDPEGSVSIINISTGVANATVQIVGFTSFNSQLTTLRNAGVRIFGPGATVAQDLEPEYIAFSGDGSTAFVTLQENNAFAVLDIPTASITQIIPMGQKNHNLTGNGFDASDRDLTSSSGIINIQNWPVFGMYQPDAIASYTVGGQTYYITANEGDARDYTGFTEEIRVGAAGYVLDPTIFPTAATLKLNNNLGRLQVTNVTGDTDLDGDFDRIDVYGARSFSIWNATGTLVFDSGDQLEQTTASKSPATFNSEGTSATFDGRSDNKGPEPEGVVIGFINNVPYAFIGIERSGDIMVYNVSDPAAPVFVQYINTPNDRALEGLTFVSAENSPTQKPLLITASEASFTVTVYEVGNAIVTNSANAGSGSLRDVIGCVVEGGTVTYDQPAVTTTILTDILNINKSITILGLSNIAKPEITVDFTTLGVNSGILIGTNKTVILNNVDFKDINNVSNNAVIDILPAGVLRVSESTIINKQ